MYGISSLLGLIGISWDSKKGSKYYKEIKKDGTGLCWDWDSVLFGTYDCEAHDGFIVFLGFIGIDGELPSGKLT